MSVADVLLEGLEDDGKVGERLEGDSLADALLGQGTVGEEHIGPARRFKIGDAVADLEDVMPALAVPVHHQALGVAPRFLSRPGVAILVGDAPRGEPGVD